MTGRPREAAPRRAELGQASLELLAGIPALVVAGLVALQLLATGYTANLADGAAEAGALAAAGGTGPRAAARAALPGWARARAQVTVGEDQVRVALAPPSPVGSLAERLRVASTAPVEGR